MSFITKHLRQLTTFWSVTGADASGDPTFAAPKALTTRREEKQAVFTNAAGEEASAGAVVFVREDMKAGDFLLLGTSSEVDPTALTDSREIQGWSKLPELTGSGFERRAFLSARSR